jgi:hypothetical protein
MSSIQLNKMYQFPYKKGIWQTGCVSEIMDEKARLFWFSSRGHMKGSS